MKRLSQESAYAYLLGEMPEEEAEALEAAVFEEDQVHEALRSWEVALIGDFLDEALAPERRARFEAKYLAHPAQRERVAFEQALRARAAAPATEASSPRAEAHARESRSRPTWLERLGLSRAGSGWMLAGLAAAAAVLLTVAPRVGSDSEPGALVKVSLRAASVRASGSTLPTVTLPEGVASGRFTAELALDDEPRRPRWEARLVRDGRTVWRGPPDRETEVAVWVSVPLSSLKAGRNELELWGGDGQPDAFVAAYPFEAVSASSPP